MKILIQGDRLIGTATDDYDGPEVFMGAPEGFAVDDLAIYRYVEGDLVVIVPAKISRRQAYQQLFLAGMLSSIETAIAAIEDPTQKKLVQIYWETSQEFERQHPMIMALAEQMLGLTPEQVDALFIEASKL